MSRTNNNQEAWHRRFQTVIGRNHIGLYPTIDEIRKEQQRSEMEIRQLEAGKSPKKPRKCVIQREKRIQKILAKYGELEILTFLRGIAHNVHL